MSVVKFLQGPFPGWDTYAYLCNAMEMAGRSVGYVEPARPPMLSFLTSLVMRTGVWSETAILIVDVALGTVGVLALYFLLARRFPRWVAACGALLLIAMPPFWAAIGTGMSDFGSVAFSICAVLATVKATEDDPRWYWAAFPLWVAASTTRFGALLVAVPLLLWLMLRARPFKDAGHIAFGVLLAALAYLPAGLWFQSKANDFAWPLQVVQQVSSGDYGVGGQVGSGAGTAASARVIPGQWYLQNLQSLLFPKQLGALSFVLLAVVVVGVLVAGASALSPKRLHWRLIVPVLATLIAAVAQTSHSTALRIGTILALGLAVAWSTRPRSDDGKPAADAGAHWSLDAMVLTWGLIFFDAQGHLAFQLDRYFLTMAPAALYFVLIGWSALAGLVVRSVAAGRRRRAPEESAHDERRRTSGTAAVTLALLAMPLAALTLLSPPPAKDPYVSEMAAVSSWLRSHVPGTRDVTIVSDAWPYTSYDFGRATLPMFSFPDARAWQWELEKRRADYYVSIHNVARTGYAKVYANGSTTVWKRVAPFDTTTPRVAYLGRGWDTYLELMGDYRFDLIFSTLNVADYHDVWALDRFTARQLDAYEAVAIYGTTWGDLGKAESVLKQYVDDGGVIIIDASANMSGPQNDLDGAVLFDVLIKRASVSRNARITLDGGLARASGSTATVDAAPFVNESGGAWYGAEYSTVHPSTRLETLARLNGRPVVQLERIGKGRVYWIADNLVWHAFIYEDDPSSDLRRPGSPETDIVRGMLWSALDLPRHSTSATAGPRPSASRAGSISATPTPAAGGVGTP
jgi:hypothetical protein